MVFTDKLYQAVYITNNHNSLRPLEKPFSYFVFCSSTFTPKFWQPVPIAQVVERPFREREVARLKPSCAIPKALKMVPVAI